MILLILNNPPYNESDKPSLIAEKINAFLSEIDAEPVEIFVGMPSRSLMIKDVTFPSAVRENLKETLRYEMEKILPVNPDEILYDYVIKNCVAGSLNI